MRVVLGTSFCVACKAETLGDPVVCCFFSTGEAETLGDHVCMYPLLHLTISAGNGKCSLNM